MNIHKNARLTPHGRAPDRERADAGGRRTSHRRLPADRAQMVEAFQGRRGRGPARSIVAAA